MISAVIVAAGRGSRMKADINKVFLPLNGKTVIEHTLSAFNNCNIDEIIVVTSDDCLFEMRKIIFALEISCNVITGGETRQESVLCGVKKASGDIVCIHDGARALVTPELINRVLADCQRYGAAAAGVKCKDTMKMCNKNGFIERTIDRESLYSIQTPQAFGRKELLCCHLRAKEEKINVTDDCSLFELYGKNVYISTGSYENIKLTTPDDMIIGEKIFKKREGELYVQNRSGI